MRSSWIRRITITTFCLAALPAAHGQKMSGGPTEWVKSEAGDVGVERLATLEYPWGMALLPDGRVLVTEKPGRLRIWADGKLSEPVEGVPKVVHRGTESEQGGLLDVEADPDFASNSLVYLSYTEAADEQPADAKEEGDPRFADYLDKTDNIVRGGAVARGKLEGNRLTGVQVIWRQTPKTVGRGHFGHRLVFAPDGKLFVTSGERMRFDPAQSLDSNLGKVVRIEPDGAIPKDNPFAAKEGALGEIYSIGHRNVLAAAVEPGSGRLWVLEMGPKGGDELNLVQPGKNYGWPLVSDGDNYGGQPIPDHKTQPELQAPVKTWTPVISPSGALFYAGALFPAWKGSLLVGGLSSKALIRLTLDGERVAAEERLDLKRRIRDVLQTPKGEILLIVDDQQGDLLRLTPSSQPPAQSGQSGQ